MMVPVVDMKKVSAKHIQNAMKCKSPHKSNLFYRKSYVKKRFERLRE